MKTVLKEKKAPRFDFIVQIVARERCEGNGSTFVPRNSLIGQFDITETQSYATETVNII